MRSCRRGAPSLDPNIQERREWYESMQDAVWQLKSNRKFSHMTSSNTEISKNESQQSNQNKPMNTNQLAQNEILDPEIPVFKQFQSLSLSVAQESLENKQKVADVDAFDCLPPYNSPKELSPSVWLQKLPYSSSIQPISSPTVSPIIVLFFHGIGGSPNDFRHLAKELQDLTHQIQLERRQSIDEIFAEEEASLEEGSISLASLPPDLPEVHYFGVCLPGRMHRTKEPSLSYVHHATAAVFDSLLGLGLLPPSPSSPPSSSLSSSSLLPNQSHISHDSPFDLSSSSTSSFPSLDPPPPMRPLSPSPLDPSAYLAPTHHPSLSSSSQSRTSTPSTHGKSSSSSHHRNQHLLSPSLQTFLHPLHIHWPSPSIAPTSTLQSSSPNILPSLPLSPLPPRFVLVGHGLGSLIAYELALKIESLALEVHRYLQGLAQSFISLSSASSSSSTGSSSPLKQAPPSPSRSVRSAPRSPGPHTRSSSPLNTSSYLSSFTFSPSPSRSSSPSQKSRKQLKSEKASLPSGPSLASASSRSLRSAASSMSRTKSSSQRSPLPPVFSSFDPQTSPLLMHLVVSSCPSPLAVDLQNRDKFGVKFHLVKKPHLYSRIEEMNGLPHTPPSPLLLHHPSSLPVLSSHSQTENPWSNPPQPSLLSSLSHPSSDLAQLEVNSFGSYHPRFRPSPSPYSPPTNLSHPLHPSNLPSRPPTHPSSIHPSSHPNPPHPSLYPDIRLNRPLIQLYLPLIRADYFMFEKYLIPKDRSSLIRSINDPNQPSTSSPSPSHSPSHPRVPQPSHFASTSMGQFSSISSSSNSTFVTSASYSTARVNQLQPHPRSASPPSLSPNHSKSSSRRPSVLSSPLKSGNSIPLTRTEGELSLVSVQGMGLSAEDLLIAQDFDPSFVLDLEHDVHIPSKQTNSLKNSSISQKKSHLDPQPSFSSLRTSKSEKEKSPEDPPASQEPPSKEGRVLCCPLTSIRLLDDPTLTPSLSLDPLPSEIRSEELKAEEERRLQEENEMKKWKGRVRGGEAGSLPGTARSGIHSESSSRPSSKAGSRRSSRHVLGGPSLSVLSPVLSPKSLSPASSFLSFGPLDQPSTISGSTFSEGRRTPSQVPSSPSPHSISSPLPHSHISDSHSHSSSSYLSTEASDWGLLTDGAYKELALPTGGHNYFLSPSPIPLPAPLSSFPSPSTDDLTSASSILSSDSLPLSLSIPSSPMASSKFGSRSPSILHPEPTPSSPFPYLTAPSSPSLRSHLTPHSLPPPTPSLPPPPTLPHPRDVLLLQVLMAVYGVYLQDEAAVAEGSVGLSGRVLDCSAYLEECVAYLGAGERVGAGFGKEGRSEGEWGIGERGWEEEEEEGTWGEVVGEGWDEGFLG